MMALEKGVLIIILVVVLAAGLPALLYISLRRENLGKQVELLRAATHRMANPWKKDEDMLKELSETLAKAQEEERKSKAEKGMESGQ